MKYLGSKNRVAKHVIPIMIEVADKSGITTWIEPFVGGGNMIDKVPDRFKRVGYDFNEHCIMAMLDIRDRPDELPDNVSEGYYKDLKGDLPASISSWIRFECSFASKFEGGYARASDGKNYAAIGSRSGKKQSPNIQAVDFIHSNYKDLELTDSLIYCDPPYQSTTGYTTGNFNHEEFFDWCRDMKNKGNIVFLSEYKAPDDFTCVWQGEQKTNFSSTRKEAAHKASERLFKL